MEVTDIETLAARMRATGMVELELRHSGALLRLTRASAAQIEPGDVPSEMRAATRAERVVRAPTVGRFVVDHPTTREPFMARGTPARRGDVIAMIECGGFLRAVVAEVEGVVRDVLADDGTLVEFGQPLFAIEVSE